MLATNDDLHGKDAGLVFTPPADGDYVVRVRDLNNKGGDGFVYYLECDFARPDFTLKCDPSKAMIGPGSRTAWYVQVARANGFAGPVKVEVQGLPAGVTVNPLTIPANMTQGLPGGLGRGGCADRCRDREGDRHRRRDRRERQAGDADARGGRRWRRFTLPGGGRGRFDAGCRPSRSRRRRTSCEVKVQPEPRHAEAGRGSEDRRGSWSVGRTTTRA